jgi:hypothetical protein
MPNLNDRSLSPVSILNSCQVLHIYSFIVRPVPVPAPGPELHRFKGIT